MTQHITLAEVKAACRKAYKEERLLAQDPTIPDYAYKRVSADGIERCCAIGTVLNDESLNLIMAAGLHNCTINNPSHRGNDASLKDVISWDVDEQKQLGTIQVFHDEWLGRVRDMYPHHTTEASFLKAIA